MTPDWRDRAACLEVDPELFFPVGVNDTAREQAAKTVCDACDVSPDCLTYALTHHPLDGVWGGTTDLQRRSILRRRTRNKERP